jgi:metal-responsive CopG/Arc/MetJ family transcriptional regulator
MAKIIVSLSEELLKEIDAYCRNFKYNRSEFVRHTVREVLKNIHDNTIEDKRNV